MMMLHLVALSSCAEPSELVGKGAIGNHVGLPQNLYFKPRVSPKNSKLLNVSSLENGVTPSALTGFVAANDRPHDIFRHVSQTSPVQIEAQRSSFPEGVIHAAQDLKAGDGAIDRAVKQTQRAGRGRGAVGDGERWVDVLVALGNRLAQQMPTISELRAGYAGTGTHEWCPAGIVGWPEQW